MPRFAPEDFTEGERLHERYRWPVTYEELVPYYELAERELRVSGATGDVAQLPASRVAYPAALTKPWEPVASAGRKLGQGVVPTPRADGAPWMVGRTGAAYNSFVVTVRPLLASPLFRLVLGAHVLRLEWNGARRCVDAVIYHDRATGERHRIGASAIVLAAGPLSSTKILLDSACADFPDGLGNTHGVLGRYLHDHPNGWAVVELDTPLPRLTHTIYLTRAPYERSDPLSAAGCVIGGATSRDRVYALTGAATHRFGVVAFGTMVPSEENYVRSHANENDSFGLPKLDLHIAPAAFCRECAGRRCEQLHDRSGKEPHRDGHGARGKSGGQARGALTDELKQPSAAIQSL